MKHAHVCIVSSCMPDEIREKLSEISDVFPLPPDKALPAPVMCHPDMILSAVGDKLILHGEYYRNNKTLIDSITTRTGLDVVLSSAAHGNVYPNDVAFNAAVAETFMLCRTPSTAHELLGAADETNLRVIHVNQGYAGCSCIVTTRAVITSDTGTHRALVSYGIKSYLADSTGIILPGYDRGFIGGCAGVIGDTIYFTGDYTSLPCAGAVNTAAAECRLKCVTLSNLPLTDYGGLKFIKIR